MNKKKHILNLAEFLFAEDKEDDECVGYLPIEVDKPEIEKMHSMYIQKLINMYEKIRKWHKRYVQ